MTKHYEIKAGPAGSAVVQISAEGLGLDSQARQIGHDVAKS